MAPIPEREFAALLGDLPAADLVGFVADLWRERGYAVREGDDPRVLVVSRDGATRHLYVHRDSWPVRRSTVEPPPGVDVVVTPRLDGVDADAGVVDARQLREMALYAVDRDACSRLFARYFDRSPTVDPVASRESVGRSVAGSLGPRRGAYAATAAVALLLLVGAIGGSAAGSFQLSGPAATPTPVETPAVAPEPTTTPPATARPIADGAAADDPSESPFPPGLGRDGIEDAQALASAHANRTSGRSYRLVVTYYERRHGTVEAASRESVAVAGPREYVSERWTLGRLETTPPILADAEAYADGTTRFERRRVGNATRYRAEPVSIRSGGEGRFADRVETYLGWYLSVTRSVVADRFERDGRTFYRVYGFGDPWPGVSNATTSALVDDAGVVHELRRVHDVPGTDREVLITIEYSDIGATAVEPPSWYPAARNATAPSSAADAPA